MSKIRVLPDRVANQIAAGEVIERPAAVVKELVENALDAGATRIEVEFNHGGRSYMRIEDNGSGMSRDDALLALERHATSKIAEADDLNRLATFGFRGEALPSIASISHFTLQTREASDDAGSEIVLNGGRMVHVRDCGRPVGTRIEVTHLFNSVPARRKFLKSDTTEAAHIIHGVRLYALAFPQVAFTLIEEGRAIFKSPQCATLEERIAGIFGRQTADGLFALEADEPGMKLRGLIGRPGVGRATRHEMICFVNQRPVDSRTLNYALIESFHESLPKGRYPVAFVFFEIDPAAVDVNVHPAKREVRFRSESSVRAFVIRAVLGRLREFSEASAPNGVADRVVGSAEIGDTGRISHLPATALPVLPPATGLGMRESERHARDGAPCLAPETIALSKSGFAPQPVAGPPSPSRSGPGEVAAPAPRSATYSWRFLGLAHGAYALFETTAGLVLLDRRAAHERIWFERLQAQFRAGAVPSQRLLLPVPVELDPIATALLLDRLEFFNGHGFEIVEFGRNFFRIESVPVWMAVADAEPFVRDLLGALRDGRLQDKNVDVARDELARLAVAKAIRLHDQAGEVELQAVLAQLFACRTPLTSPSGRPTQIEFSLGELERRFQK
jgi:DNA mismatch repair protein MutL